MVAVTIAIAIAITITITIAIFGDSGRNFFFIASPDPETSEKDG
jgi:hypothetical protein